jgi:hypothetical protein
MPGCEIVLTVTASWLICVCVDFVYVLLEAETLIYGGF